MFQFLFNIISGSLKICVDHNGLNKRESRNGEFHNKKNVIVYFLFKLNLTALQILVKLKLTLFSARLSWVKVAGLGEAIPPTSGVKLMQGYPRP